MLLLVACRSRFSDLDSAKSMTVTKDVVHIEVSETKTSGTITDRLPLLVCGPVFLASHSK